MSNVREVVVGAMQDQGLGGYIDRAAPVIDTLSERDANIAIALIDAGVSMGASEANVRDLMFEVGLMTRPVAVPEPEAAESNGHSDTDLAATLSRINERLDGLERIARNYGARV